MDMEEENSKLQPIASALEQLRMRLNELYAQAEGICKQHFDFAMDMNKKRTWEEKSILFVQPRIRDNAMSVTWYEVHWYGSKAVQTRRMVKKVIVKPKEKPAYNMDTLLKRAQHWEVDMVREIEQQLIPLRWEAAFIAKAIGHLNHITRSSR